MPIIPRKTINTTYIHTDMLQFSRHPFGHASEIQPQAERPDSDPSKACILIDELTRAVRLTRYDAHKDDAGLAEGPRLSEHPKSGHT